jgi:membrane-bound inhibitor of C-type lysozyme
MSGMNTTTRGLIALIVVIILIGIVFFVVRGRMPNAASTGQPVATATFSCNGGKDITAAFYSGSSTTSTNPAQPPTPGGSVQLTLADGRSMTLPQTVSADGARYASADESIVFWNKGNGVTFTENGQPTYMGCIRVAADPGGLPKIYSNGTQEFSIRYPEGSTVDEGYQYQALGPGKNIGGIKFSIPASVASGTNLSPDSYLSVEEIPQASSCSAALFLDQGAMAHAVSDGATTYSVASTTGAGAGNRYEETVYALPGTNPCVAVRYFIHYGVIGNYPAGSVKEFDRAALLAQFDAMRRTLIFGQ